MSRRIKGITIVLNAETTGLDKALKDVNDRSSDINKELRDTNRLLRFSPDSAELMAQKQKLLGDQVAATSEKLETLRKVEGQVAAQAKSGEISAKQYRDFQKEIIQTESQLKHYEKLLRDVDSATVKLGKNMQEAGKKWQESGSNIADVGKSLTKGITVPVAAIGTLATKSAIEFETGMAGVRKTTDMTTDELEEMGQALRDMAKEIPVSVNDLTELAETAGQLGIEKENLVSFTRVMADLAVATNIAGQEGATSMAQFANITQMSQKDFDRMGATIVELGNNTATTERDILNMATRLAAAGKQASMSQSDILGIAAGLASLGLEAQAGGSAFSKVINQIQLSVDTGSEDLEDYARVAGMSAETFASAWGEDAAGALSKFIIGLGDTERHGQSTNEILDELGITELRMGDALRRTSGANELFNDTLAMSNRAWAENIALTTEASILYETTQSKLTIAKNKLNDTAIELGNNLLPVISDVAEWAGSLVEKFTDLSPKTQSLIIKMGAFAAALGPVLTIGGNLKKLFGTVSDGIGKLIEKIGHGVGALGGFTTGGAVGTAIAGIGALVGAIALLASTYESTTTKIYDLIKATEESAKAFQTTISDMEAANAETKSLGDRYFELAEKTRLSNAEQEELKWISEDLVKVMPELNELLDEETGLLKMGKDAWEEYFDAKSEHDKQKADYERRKELATEYDELLKKLAIAQKERVEAEARFGDSTALDAAKRLSQTKDNVDKLTGALDLNREAWVEAGGQTEDGARRAEWAAGMIEYAYGDVADAADEVVDRIGGAQRHYNETEKEFTDRLEASAKHREEIIELEKKAREDYFKDIEKGTEDNLKSMSGFSKKRLDLSKTTTSEFINHLIEEREAFNNYHENLKIIAERVGPDVAAELEKLGPDAAPLIDDFVKDTGTALEELAEIFGLRLDDANRVAEEKAKELNGAKYGADFIQGLIDGMEDKRAALKAKAASLSAEIIGSTVATLEERSPSRIAMESGANWVKGLEIGLESRRKELAEKAESLANEINTATKEANEQLQIDLKEFDADYKYDREKAVRDYTKSVANIRERASKENRKLTKDEHWDLADLERSHKQDMIDMEVRYQDDRLKLISQASIDVVAAGEKHVEQQKWIGEMSLYEEGIYWNAMYLSLEKGTDAYERALSNHQSAVARMRSEMESATEKYSSQVRKIDEGLARETERINKNYENESKRINEQRIRDSEEVRKKLEGDIQSLQDAYESSYENRVSQLTNITGLFDKYQRKTAVPETALIRHLESQVDALKDYSAAMESVKDRVDNEDLIAELEKLGPNSLAELEAINRMTDDQLAEFVGLYEERFRLASEQATEELAPLKADTEKQINELKDAAQRSLQEINRVANQELAQLESDMRAQLQKLNDTATEELKALENEWLQIVSDIIGGSEKQFDSMRNVGLEAIGKLEQGLLDGESSLMTEANRIANRVQTVIASALNIPESSLPDSNAGIAAGQLGKLGAGTGGGTSGVAGSGYAATAGGITQHITINSPDPLTPSEVARQTKNASQQLAMEW